MTTPFLHTYARYPLELVQGEGRRVQDVEGRWYLDAICGIAVNALGHRHPRVQAAIHAQVDRLLHVSNLYHVDVQRRFAQTLTRMYGGGAVFLCNSGTEANESSVKLVRKYHWRRGDPRAEIIVLKDAFHGRTFMALSMTPRARYQEGFGPLAEGIRVAAHEDAAGMVSEKTAAVFVEPIQGEGGCRPVTVLPELREACDAHGALLVYDEIQCGLGRSGELLHEPRPDITSLAKALGGGLPLGATLASPKVAEAFQPGDHGSTFGGNPVACAAGLATLEIILEENLATRCATLGARLRMGLEAAGADVSGQGLMLGARTGMAPTPIIHRMRDRGVLVCPAGGDAVRFLPAFNSTEEEIDDMIAAFAGAWEDARSAPGSSAE
ncbi:MAG: aminotransferase class III-fold pyridoxal phosphate-dependent enzyme [Myxococcota bacterium]